DHDGIAREMPLPCTGFGEVCGLDGRRRHLLPKGLEILRMLVERDQAAITELREHQKQILADEPGGARHNDRMTRINVHCTLKSLESKTNPVEEWLRHPADHAHDPAPEPWQIHDRRSGRSRAHDSARDGVRLGP